MQDNLIFTPCDVGLASTYLQVLTLVESGFVRGVGQASVEKVYRSTCAPLSADRPDQPMHPIPSQPPSVSDLKRAMNQLMFWCTGSRSQPAHPGLSQPGNRHVQRHGTGEGEGGNLLEVLGDWSATPLLLACLGIQTSEGQEDRMIPDDREEYGDLCGAYSIVESLSFADAFLDRRDLRVLEVGCRFFEVFYSVHLFARPFSVGGHRMSVSDRQKYSSHVQREPVCNRKRRGR